MNRYAFNRLFSDLTVRVKEEGKKNSSWLMGFLQGLGKRKLTGYQCAAFVDLLLVIPEEPEKVDLPTPAVPVEKYVNNMKTAVGATQPRP